MCCYNNERALVDYLKGRGVARNAPISWAHAISWSVAWKCFIPDDKGDGIGWPRVCHLRSPFGLSVGYLAGWNKTEVEIPYNVDRPRGFHFCRDKAEGVGAVLTGSFGSGLLVPIVVPNRCILALGERQGVTSHFWMAELETGFYLDTRDIQNNPHVSVSSLMRTYVWLQSRAEEKFQEGTAWEEIRHFPVVCPAWPREDEEGCP